MYLITRFNPKFIFTRYFDLKNTWGLFMNILNISMVRNEILKFSIKKNTYFKTNEINRCLEYQKIELNMVLIINDDLLT